MPHQPILHIETSSKVLAKTKKNQKTQKNQINFFFDICTIDLFLALRLVRRDLQNEGKKTQKNIFFVELELGFQFKFGFVIHRQPILSAETS
jgi:hypothetical protein